MEKEIDGLHKVIVKTKFQGVQKCTPKSPFGNHWVIKEHIYDLQKRSYSISSINLVSKIYNMIFSRHYLFIFQLNVMANYYELYWNYATIITELCTASTEMGSSQNNIWETP